MQPQNGANAKSKFSNFLYSIFLNRFFWCCTWWQALKVILSDCFGFWRKIYIMPKMGKIVIFGPKIIFLRFFIITFSEMVIKKCICFKITFQSDYFRFSGKICVRHKMGEMGQFWACREHFWTVLSIIYQIFLKLHLKTSIKKGLKWLFWILKENLYFAQNGINGSSVTIHCTSYLLVINCWYISVEWHVGFIIRFAKSKYIHFNNIISDIWRNHEENWTKKSSLFVKEVRKP